MNWFTWSWKSNLQKFFGSSGVRGIVNDFLTPNLTGSIGLASASHFNAKKAIVGRDTRVSGLMIEEALISGLVSCGVDVNCVGIVPTPVLAFLTKKLAADIGFMLTASHNPAQYNGIKIFDKNGLSISYEQQKNIEDRVKEKNYFLTDWKKIGKTVFVNAGPAFEGKAALIEIEKGKVKKVRFMKWKKKKNMETYWKKKD